VSDSGEDKGERTTEKRIMKRNVYSSKEISLNLCVH